MDLKLQQPIVQLKNVQFRYQGQSSAFVIEKFTLNANERVYIYGPSGCGKSTFLGLVTGVLQAQSGHVHVLGEDFTTCGARRRDRLRGQRMGYIFQMFNMIPYLSVLDNIVLPCALNQQRGLWMEDKSLHVVKQTAVTLAMDLGLGDVLHKKAGKISVGQQQRVAAARALIGGPDVICADEPTSSLDTDNREAFMKILMEQCEQSKTSLLFVSHDQSLSQSFKNVLPLKGIVQTLMVCVLSVLMFSNKAQGLNFDINVQADTGFQWLVDQETDNNNSPYTANFYGFDGDLLAVSNISFGKPVDLRVGLGFVYTTLKGSVQGYDNANPGNLTTDSTVASGQRPHPNNFYDMTEDVDYGAALVGLEYVARVLVGVLWGLPKKFALVLDGIFDYGIAGDIASNGDDLPNNLISPINSYMRYGGVLALEYNVMPKFYVRGGVTVAAATIQSTVTYAEWGNQFQVLNTTSAMNYVGSLGVAYEVYGHRPASNETTNATNPNNSKK